MKVTSAGPEDLLLIFCGSITSLAFILDLNFSLAMASCREADCAGIFLLAFLKQLISDNRHEYCTTHKKKAN